MNGWFKPALAEFIGTFGLIFMGAGSIVMNDVTQGALGLVGIAFAHGLAIALGVSALGHICGGHFNPAVTVGFLTTRRIGVGMAAIYVTAQLLGALVAALFVVSLFPADSVAKVNLGNPALGPGIGPLPGILIEAVLTFFLVLVIFGTAVDTRGARHLGGMGIGLAIVMDILAAGPLTGAAMNPARSFGTAVPMAFFQDHYVYWIGPIIGAVIAALLYEHVFIARSRVETHT